MQSTVRLNNVSERGAKQPSGTRPSPDYWHTLATLARWCRIRSYLDSAAAHGISALDAIPGALEANPGYPSPRPEKGDGKTQLTTYL